MNRLKYTHTLMDKLTNILHKKKFLSKKMRTLFDKMKMISILVNDRNIRC